MIFRSQSIKEFLFCRPAININLVLSQVKTFISLSPLLQWQYEVNIRQGECLSPFLFAMYLNDIEDEFREKGAEGLDIGLMKMFLLLYADDIIIFFRIC